MKYTKEQFEQVKQRCPKCIFPRHLKDGSISFMVRVTTMMGDKRTLITTADLREAKQVLADFQAKRAPEARKETNALDILDEITIPTDIYDYLSELPPHEITAEGYLFMPTARGDGYVEISPAMQSEFLRRQFGISAGAAPATNNTTSEETYAEEDTQDNDDGPVRDYSSAFFAPKA